MNTKINRISILILSSLLVFSLILGIFIPNSLTKMKIEFTHSKINTYPGQTTWLVAQVKPDFIDLNSVDSFSIIINTQVNYEIKIWSSPKSNIVEIFLHPNSSHLGLEFIVTLTISIGKITAMNQVIISVIDWSNHLQMEIQEMVNYYTNYLIENYSGYTAEENNSLCFLGTIPQILIVEHYLYRTTHWELELSRHVMISPHDWVRITIRSRNSFKPIWSGEISSWNSSNLVITEILPPDNIFR